MFPRSFLSAIFASVALAVSAPALAADAPVNAAAAQTQQQSTDNISDKDLQKFVDAQKDLQAIRNDYQSKAQTIQKPAEMQTLQDDMQQDMVKAVENTGLDIDTYNQVSQLAMQDKGLQKRLNKLMQ